jgi:hypothetical protein
MIETETVLEALEAVYNYLHGEDNYWDEWTDSNVDAILADYGLVLAARH